MQILRSGFFFILLLSASVSHSQNVVFKNYGVKEGLAGSIVYHVIQDKKGFMWFGTDQGLSRFDGTHFKTYTTRDGLPDNDVFRVAEDSIGRLWMTCYNSKPCFLYKGVIHNSENDTLLQSIEAEDILFRDINIDRQGRVWLVNNRMYLVDGNKVFKFNSPGYTKEDCPTAVGYIGDRLALQGRAGVFYIHLKNDTVSYECIDSGMLHTTFNSPCFVGNACYIIEMVSSKGGAIIKVSDDTTQQIDLYSFGIKDVVASHLIFRPSDSSLLLSSGTQGMKAFDLDLNPRPDPFPFLPGNITYSFTAFDREGNTWVASLGKGVFFIPADKTIHYRLDHESGSSNATSVYGGMGKDINKQIFIGFDYSTYAVLKDKKLARYVIRNEATVRNRIVTQCRLNDYTILFGTDLGIYSVNIDDVSHPKQLNINGVKDLVSEGNDSVLVGGGGFAYRLVKKDTGYQTSVLWNQRTTAIVKDKIGRIWLGGVNGVFVNEKGTTSRFTQNPLISKSRITDLLCDAFGNIWVATHQRGVFIITRDTILTINTLNGLTEDVCMRLFEEDKGLVWVCTNRHLAKVSYQNSENFSFTITPFGELMGNEVVSVNDLFVDTQNIWVATSSGLLQLEKAGLKTSMPSPVYITAFRSADSVFTDFSSLCLPYFHNNIQIDYVGISYNSAGKMAYKYVLDGDTIFTKNTSLNLNALSPGEYSLRVWAKNIAGVWSTEPAILTFAIVPPFWKTWWFLLMLLIALVVGIWAIVRFRIRQIRKRDKEKADINRKIAETELQAVRAQMNEHFVFNSLNSIQNFINQNNTEAANFYLSSFGKLVRRTLDLSSMPVISLKDEMDYLDNYLNLEKMRFETKFDYSITNHIPDYSADMLNFPSMILQPYVENAINHGLVYKTDGMGLLRISFAAEKGFIVCRIDDNGIGRRKSQELKSKRPTGHISRGIKLSESRVALFNNVNDDKIHVEVIDKTNEQGEATGTTVIVYVPLIENVWQVPLNIIQDK